MAKNSDSALEGAVFLTDVELAQRWGISPKTLRNNRVLGVGVPFVRLGRAVRYAMATVVAYEAANTVSSTSRPSEAGPCQ
ncbi:DNA-binding protein [Lichenihabitans sp. Uapishka_5]|uniref:DNA-binding protein n=1 Tax=Lichenihabitans sp. Uapishka_5 TaxID=3037302 RepID=UPI0029E7EDD2|nr:DNA-binding protein [Lichenihabitans sp. Uapishka_5]MDX7949941.1 DNA-binding protein [Lichenihabitans sp. Uapishka_5]